MIPTEAAVGLNLEYPCLEQADCARGLARIYVQGGTVDRAYARNTLLGRKGQDPNRAGCCVSSGQTGERESVSDLAEVPPY